MPMSLRPGPGLAGAHMYLGEGLTGELGEPHRGSLDWGAEGLTGGSQALSWRAEGTVIKLTEGAVIKLTEGAVIKLGDSQPI